ncbi:MAG TPA: hypothetical protein IAB92_05730 [Candidatus Faecousia faecigallinarum]|nr:hypothetical protein [Candidatus Faecousia faecigallinarum]
MINKHWAIIIRFTDKFGLKNNLYKMRIDKIVHLCYIYPGREGINLVLFPGALEIFNYPPALNKNNRIGGIFYDAEI